jgi:hypothetical protein
MTQRKSYGTAANGGALVVHENLPFEELGRPNPQAAPSGPVNRRSNGTVADSEALGSLAGGADRERPLHLASCVPWGSCSSRATTRSHPRETAGQDYTEPYVASLARMFDGDGTESV